MAEQNTTCKSCGRPGARIVETEEKYTAPFGNPVTYKVRYSECDNCTMEIDLSDANEFPNAVQLAEKNSVDEILKYLKEHGITQKHIERCLELPDRQVSNWKSKEAWSKSALALLRILRAYPWILDVADKHFNEASIRDKLVEAANAESKGLRSSPAYGYTDVALGKLKSPHITRHMQIVDGGGAWVPNPITAYASATGTALGVYPSSTSTPPRSLNNVVEVAGWSLIG